MVAVRAVGKAAVDAADGSRAGFCNFFDFIIGFLLR